MMVADVYIIDAARTPFGRHRGGLSGVRTDDLAAIPLVELFRRNPAIDPAGVRDVIYGNTNGAGEENRNVARMAVLLAGLPVSVPGSTVNRLCASGNEALIQAARAVAVGDMDLVVAGGVEGMSRAPFVLPKPDQAMPQAMTLHQTTVGWRLVNERMPEHWTEPLGTSAERVAQELGISREAQDAWALRSHQRAAAAWDAGLHADYVVPVGDVIRDEAVRPDATAEALGSLRSAFSPMGAVTAGNSSPISDGAIAMLLGSRAVVDELALSPLGRLSISATVAVEPDRFAVAPIPAIEAVLKRAGMQVADVDVWEINEAFAAMVLSVMHGLRAFGEIDPETINPHGGAIALGHPLGASAPRTVIDLCRELARRGGGSGIAAACIGVGQGQAVVCHVD